MPVIAYCLRHTAAPAAGCMCRRLRSSGMIRFFARPLY